MADSVATHEGSFPATKERTTDLSGSLTEAGGGAAAIVLGVLGLVNVAPNMLVSVAAIVVGGCFLIYGGVVASRFARASAAGEVRRGVVGESLTMESLCGATGIILGVLALVGEDPAILVPVAAIVFGGGLLAASGTSARLNAATASPEREHHSEALSLVLGPSFLIGLTGIVLGILALAAIHPIVLSLVAMLTFGVSFMLTTSSFASMA